MTAVPWCLDARAFGIVNLSGVILACDPLGSCRTQAEGQRRCREGPVQKMRPRHVVCRPRGSPRRLAPSVVSVESYSRGGSRESDPAAAWRMSVDTHKDPVHLSIDPFVHASMRLSSRVYRATQPGSPRRAAPPVSREALRRLAEASGDLAGRAGQPASCSGG